MTKTDGDIEDLNTRSKEHAQKLDSVLSEVRKVIVGQEDILQKLVISLIADGHVLLEGIPGLAKTLMIKTLSYTINVAFCRIQFTPDPLPADIIGTKIYDQRKGTFSIQMGPIFHNFILADEINRAPPKVQSALLEAIQERQVRIQGKTFKLERPFLVLATQNPIETEGTYRLPEAQVDRFALKLLIDYPKKYEERLIIQRNTRDLEINSERILGSKEIIAIQKFNQSIYADEKIESYVADIVDATRHPDEYGLDLNGMIEYGASPRASIWLVLCGKAHAAPSRTRLCI